MRTFLSFLDRSRPARILLLFLVALLVTTHDHLVAHATSGPLNFDMQPLITDPLNPVTRSYFVMNSNPDTRLQNSILFTNFGTTSGTLKLYPVDALTAPQGGTAFHKNTDPRKDVGTWITLSKQQITLQPGQTLIVPFQVHIPPHTRPGQHIGGIAAEDQSLQTIAAQGKLHIHLQQRRVLAVQVNLPGTSIEKLEILGLHPDNAHRYQRLQITLANTGTMMLRPTGTLLISDLKGHHLQQQNFQLFTFLPQTSITYPAFIQRKALPIGRYHAVLTFTYGHHHVLSYQTLFTIKAKQKTLFNALSTLVTLGDSQDTLALFTPWQLAIGGIILLLILVAVSFWLYKVFMLLARSCMRRKPTANTKEVAHSHMTTDGSFSGKDRGDFPGQHPR